MGGGSARTPFFLVRGFFYRRGLDGVDPPPPPGGGRDCPAQQIAVPQVRFFAGLPDEEKVAVLTPTPSVGHRLYRYHTSSLRTHRLSSSEAEPKVMKGSMTEFLPFYPGI